MEYGALLIAYPSWTPEDVKAMSPRERKYWKKLAEYVVERRIMKGVSS